ncbi:phage late control D family protein [Mesobacillus thioparans]|uniref:phage late control D family protein n=1 Tax=Mesobacillus thioparans TaxID=370439 RepID=UPI0039EE8E35
MESGRRTILDVLYNNQKISNDIAPFISKISHTDNFIGEADSISITLSDRENRWIGPWMPKIGASLNAALISSGWDTEKSIRRKLGYFEIDKIEVGGPPASLTIGGISVPESSSLRGEAKFRSWEKTTLKKVATDIAQRNKVQIYFDSSDNPTYDRVEQEYETELSFLKRLCTDAGLALKVTNNSIAIMDERKFEMATEVATIKRSSRNLKDYQFENNLTGTFRSCKVQYTIPKKKKTIHYTFTPSKGPKTDRVLIVNEEVKNEAEAMKLAKNRLRAENKKAISGSITIAGISPYYAGQTLILDEFGFFNGKYIITSVTIDSGSGSSTTLDLRKCLEGY